MWWCVLAALAWASDGSPEVDLRYTLRPIDFAQSYGFEPSEVDLLRQLQGILQEQPKLTIADATGKPIKDLRALPGASMMALIPTVSRPESLGVETDLIVPFAGKRYAVTVWWDRVDRVRVTQSEAPPTLVTPSDRAAVEALGLRLVERDRTWEPEVLGTLVQAFALLPPEDQATVRGLEFVRVAGPDPDLLTMLPVLPETGIAAIFRLDQGPGQIEIYDSSRRRDGLFVGTQDRPYGVLLRAILHEMGHAVASQTLLAYNTQVAEANALVVEYNTKAQVFNARLEASGGADRKALAALSKELEDLNARLLEAQRVLAPVDPTTLDRSISAVSHAMLDVAPLSRNVTRYGRAHPEEAFAEVYATYLCDPDALKRVSPTLHAWMASGRWRRELTQPMVDWR